MDHSGSMQPRHLRRRGLRSGGVLTLTLTLAVMTALGVVWGWTTTENSASSSAASVPETPEEPAWSGTPSVQVGSTSLGPASGPVAEAVAALRAWDRARADAWARGAVADLAALYVGRAGASDARLLREYLERGLRVEGMRTQLLAVEVLARGEGHWRLRVTDRLARAVAVGDAGRHVLPRDEATTRVVELVRSAEGWRVAEVR